MRMENLSKHEAIDFLARDIEGNIAYINFLENNPITELLRCGSSLLFKGTSDWDWVYIMSENRDELLEMTGSLTDQDKNFALVQAWMLPLLARGRRINWQMASLRLQLPQGAALPQPGTTPVKLLPAHADAIYRLWPYAELTTLAYTRDRIARGHSAAIFHGDEPVAWAITHDDGAIGFLFVREEYRGRGYARDVTVAVARQLQELGKPAFVHIEPDNHKSLSLARKLGFAERGTVMWVGY